MSVSQKFEQAKEIILDVFKDFNRADIDFDKDDFNKVFNDLIVDLTSAKDVEQTTFFWSGLVKQDVEGRCQINFVNGAALKELDCSKLQDTTQYLNNICESSHLPFRHKERSMQNFKKKHNSPVIYKYSDPDIQLF